MRRDRFREGSTGRGRPHAIRPIRATPPADGDAAILGMRADGVCTNSYTGAPGSSPTRAPQLAAGSPCRMFPLTGGAVKVRQTRFQVNGSRRFQGSRDRQRARVQ